MGGTSHIEAAIAAAREIMLPDLLTVEDLAPRLKVTPGAVRRLLRTGVLPGRKVGRRWIVERRGLLLALSTSPVPALHLVQRDRPQGAESHGAESQGDEP